MNRTLKTIAALLLALTIAAAAAGCGEKDQILPEETMPAEIIQVQPKKEKCTDLGTPLADLRVRKALALAIDTDTLIEALFYENAVKTDSFLEVARNREFDPDQAKELLAEAGWPADYVLDVVYTGDAQTEDLLKVIGTYWDAVGVKAEFRKLEGDVRAQLWTAPENPAEDDSAVLWDLAFLGFEPLTGWECYESFASFSPNHSHTPAREDLDDWIRKAADGEANQREEACGQIQQLITEQVLAIPLLRQNLFRYTSSHLTNTEKDILSWTTDREDETLYTNGAPMESFRDMLDRPDRHLYQQLVFQRLIRAEGDLSPAEGTVAESYAISEDGRQIEFVLREGLLWQDGEPLTAEDVKFTFELYLRSPDSHPVLRSVLDALEGAADWKDGITEDCSGITVEENKVIFRFQKAAPDAVTVFSRWPVLPQHCLKNAVPENLGKHAFWKAPIGSGPYRVAQTEMGACCVLERWEDFSLTGEGNIQKIYMAASPETDEDLVLRADRDMLDLAWGSSTDDAWAMEQMEQMRVEVRDLAYLRCFFINQFPHESYLAQPDENA